MMAVELHNIANISILLLREKTKNKISSLLNPHKLLSTEHGLPRDWQGLAELCGIPGELIPGIINESNPTALVLKLWYDQFKTEATIGKLLFFLEQMDRTDVVDDVLPLIAEDLKFCKENPPNGRIVSPFDLEAEKHILTRDDVVRINEGLEPQLYDAFVLFADDDIAFAMELIENMERNYNLKLCVKDRLVVGGSELDAMIKMITERCRTLIVIVSRAFLESNENKFFYSLAQSNAIEQRELKKIIPCIYKECGILPPNMKWYFKLDFRNSSAFWNVWDRLHDSIKLPEYKSEIKLNLNRSRSYPNQFTQPNDLRPALHKESNSSSQTMASIKLSSSMSNLPHTNVPRDNMTPSTKKNLSFYERIKSLGSEFPKSKSKVPKQKERQKSSAI